MLLGAISGVVASIMLWGLIRYGDTRVEELKLLQNQDRLFILLASLMALGIFVAAISTWRAVSKYLRLSLDDLY